MLNKQTTVRLVLVRQFALHSAPKEFDISHGPDKKYGEMKMRQLIRLKRHEGLPNRKNYCMTGDHQ